MSRMSSRAPASVEEAAAEEATEEEAAPWALPILRGPRYSQSLERGLAILGCFTSENPVLGIADIAEELGMSRSTTHRYVTTLLALGYLEQGKSRKYRLGLRVTDLGMSALNSTGLREHVHPFLEELRQRTGYTVGLAVLDGAEILYVDRARSWRRGQREVDIGLHPGSRMPAYCTAMGKVLLAYLPYEVQSELIAQLQLKRHSPSTIASKQALRAELEQVAEDGYAVNDQELKPGMHAIAVPVRDESREVAAAIGIAASPEAISLPELIDALSPHLIATADRISSRLGYRRDDEL
jgi:IclR family transcriptional regulator, pca regulon regulatory protein